MKNLLKKLHIVSNNQSKDLEGSTSKVNRFSDASLSPPNQSSEHKPFSTLSGWLNSVTSRRSPSPPSSSNATRGDRIEQSDSASSAALDAALDAVMCDSESSNSRDPDIEEEYQIQLALELSAREDPEAVQIEAVKQISLSSFAPENTPAEVVAFQYWNYNVLSYNDKIPDGFYDLYGILMDSTSTKMPSLVDLQGTLMSDNITWEAVLVNKASDAKLLRLEQKALQMAVNYRPSDSVVGRNLVQKLAVLVSNHMGGPVGDPDNMLIAWRCLSHNLKVTLKSMVLPLGSLNVGLARHRALLFKVLADSIGLPCRLVKGQEYTGSDDVAMNLVKIDDGREYIVDLMADPGTLIPSDAAGSHTEYEEPFSREIDSSHVASSSSGIIGSFEEHSHFEKLTNISHSRNFDTSTKYSNDRDELTPCTDLIVNTISEGEMFKETSIRPSHPNIHARSPSWTEGVSSPAANKMKVKDVSRYMIDAAKENPQLAQKLHDVLLESGVVAPPNLFTEIYKEQSNIETAEANSMTEYTQKSKGQGDFGQARYLPPLPYRDLHSKVNVQTEGQDLEEGNVVIPVKYDKNVPVVAAAAAVAAVASSMVVAVTRTTNTSGLELPAAAAATATAAALVAATAAVSNQYDNLEADNYEPRRSGANQVGERVSDRSMGNESTKSDAMLDEVADCEIPWEDITIGERIGLGSYGEVYCGDWHGTEVAVKKFLDQELTGESLEEFKSEIVR